MRNQQQAEKEEQRRIKNLVLNYDLRDENESTDGDTHFSIIQPNPNKPNLYFQGSQENRLTERRNPQVGIEKQPQNPYLQPRLDKAGSNARNQRARKLQLSDVDWYGTTNSSPAGVENGDGSSMDSGRDRPNMLGQPPSNRLQQQRRRGSGNPFRGRRPRRLFG
jgi:regulator of nonsense transcripts 2